MEKKAYTVSVALRLYGDKLEPHAISETFDTQPSKSHRKDDKKITSGGNEVTRRTGLWSLDADSKLLSMSEKVNDLIRHAEKISHWIKSTQLPLIGLKGVEDGHIDIFIADLTDRSGSKEFYFELSERQVAQLAVFGLPIHFTVDAVGNENLPR